MAKKPEKVAPKVEAPEKQRAVNMAELAIAIMSLKLKAVPGSQPYDMHGYKIGLDDALDAAIKLAE